MTKSNEVIAEKPFQNRGVFVNAWPSWIDNRRQYILLVSNYHDLKWLTAYHNQTWGRCFVRLWRYSSRRQKVWDAALSAESSSVEDQRSSQSLPSCHNNNNNSNYEYICNAQF